MPVSEYNELSYGYGWIQLGPVQANLKVYNTTNMNVLGPYKLYHYMHKSLQDLAFNIIDTEGSV